MLIFRKKRRNKACVIGLDGVPFSLLQDLADRGIMSTMARLIASGRLHRMKASLPEISSVSWTNFMTGSNPGEHGIFGFTDFKPGTYEIRFPNFLDVRRPVLWETLGEKGYKSIVINQPSTYPARKIDGVLVSGFVALDLAKAVYPPAYRTALEQIGYQIDIDTLRARDDPEFLWQELGKTLTGRQKALNFFWEEPWDYFEFVVTGTDRLHHFLWNAYPDPAHPHHQAFLDYYRQIDRLIGKIYASWRKVAEDDEGLYLLSDHGFTGIVQEVYLNAWLEKHGYLKFTVPEPKGLEDIHARTRAFALDPNRIYLNLRGRFPKGTVERSDRKALREDIAHKLERLEFEGRKVVRRVIPADQIYKGPLAAKGPDLIVLAENGFDMKGSLKKKDVFGRTSLQGMHTWDDAFLWAARPLGDDLAIEDVAGSILKNFS